MLLSDFAETRPLSTFPARPALAATHRLKRTSGHGEEAHLAGAGIPLAKPLAY